MSFDHRFQPDDKSTYVFCYGLMEPRVGYKTSRNSKTFQLTFPTEKYFLKVTIKTPQQVQRCFLCALLLKLNKCFEICKTRYLQSKRAEQIQINQLKKNILIQF